MGRIQIQSLNLLSMNAGDLREAIFKEVEKNPALEIVSDKFESGLQSARYKNSPDGNLRERAASSAGEEKSQAFQEILESRADERESLYAHLTGQLNLLPLNAREKSLCQKIIGNLDARGFFILAPLSLLDKKAGETQALLDKCMEIIRRLDPPGVCVENFEKSLALQARLKGGASRLALFLLDGHLDFLDPPQEQKILEKIQGFLKKRKKLSFAKEDFGFLWEAEEKDAREALEYIKGLDPFPARRFDQTQARYVWPDIYVDNALKVRISDSVVPVLRIAPDFAKSKKDSKFAKAAVQSAKAFLESLEYRENTIAKAACAIVARQIDFFKDGPGKLLPLRQFEIAREIGVHESTISRMASSKYLQCQWGLFPVKYFFTSSVAGVSKESALCEIQKIIEENSGKKMSDQKICDELCERGIKISRRAVAKYRAQMRIENSYLR